MSNEPIFSKYFCEKHRIKLKKIASVSVNDQIPGTSAGWGGPRPTFTTLQLIVTNISYKTHSF